MPSISNGRASAYYVGRVSSGTFVRPIRLALLLLLLLLGTWGAVVFLLPLCKCRAVLCFSRDTNHEISLDKLMYFSRCFSLFEIHSLIYLILGTRRRSKNIRGINWNNYARKIPGSAWSRRVAFANYPCNEQIKVVPESDPKRAEQRDVWLLKITGWNCNYERSGWGN